MTIEQPQNTGSESTIEKISQSFTAFSEKIHKSLEPINDAAAAVLPGVKKFIQENAMIMSLFGFLPNVSEKLETVIAKIDGILKYIHPKLSIAPAATNTTPTSTETKESNNTLGEKMAAELEVLKKEPYVFCGRLGAQIPNTNARFNKGIDCIGVWWFLNEKFHWKTLQGKALQWNDFSKDGFEYVIPLLSNKFEEFTFNQNNREIIRKKLQGMPDGTLLAFTSHVGVIRGGKLFNAKSPRHGVIDEDFPLYPIGEKIRILRPEHIKTA